MARRRGRCSLKRHSSAIRLDRARQRDKPHQKSGSFPPPALPGFIGRTTLSDSRSVRRQMRRWSCELQPKRASPDYPCHPSSVPCPHTPADRTGACVDCFPVHAAFPVTQAGRHPHLHFRGLLRLYSRYGPLNCSTAQSGLCHEASTRLVAEPSCSSATRSIDNSLGGTFLHWRYAPSGRTEKSGLATLEAALFRYARRAE